ncbi:hypothetical protein ONE63_006207 [Megalurothrips usitatus]|uniref:Uncharacterized protein n=1 Tax=Megalurothrips usitatus TaxID=439358 RepID=A0AAV7XSP2_9NEOP|nr:hypothetical protein ONE63_006207 [Megalurothrips usitatus]
MDCDPRPRPCPYLGPASALPLPRHSRDRGRAPGRPHRVADRRGGRPLAGLVAGGAARALRPGRALPHPHPHLRHAVGRDDVGAASGREPDQRTHRLRQACRQGDESAGHDGGPLAHVGAHHAGRAGRLQGAHHLQPLVGLGRVQLVPERARRRPRQSEGERRHRHGDLLQLLRDLRRERPSGRRRSAHQLHPQADRAGPRRGGRRLRRRQQDAAGPRGRVPVPGPVRRAAALGELDRGGPAEGGGEEPAAGHAEGGEGAGRAARRGRAGGRRLPGPRGPRRPQGRPRRPLRLRHVAVHGRGPGARDLKRFCKFLPRREADWLRAFIRILFLNNAPTRLRECCSGLVRAG